MKHAASSGQPLHQVEESAMLTVDLVGRLETDYPVGATDRAAAGWTQMIPEAARGVLLLFALAAFIDRHVIEAFEE